MKTSSEHIRQNFYPVPVVDQSTARKFPLGPGARAMAKLAWRPEAAVLLQAHAFRPARARSWTGVSGTDPLLLSARKLAQARSYYLRHGHRYPADLVAEIQAKVGVARTGEMDALTILAVARYQRAKELRACSGCADAQTLKAMFGADVRMRKDAYPGPVVSHEDIDGIWQASVKLTAKIKRAWQRLRPHLPEGAVLIAGLRTWGDSARKLEDTFADNASEIVARGMLNPGEVADILAAKNYQQMHNWVWSTRDGITQYKVALPGQSRHCGGDAFDVSGASLRSILAAVADARLADPQFNAMFEGYTQEPSGDYVHIDLR